MIQQIRKLLEAPSIASIIQKDLYEAQRTLLETEKQVEYHTAIAIAMKAQIKRLKAGIA